MAKKKKELKVPNGKSWFYKLVSVFTPLIFKKPQIINLAGEIADKSIVVVNHSAKSGPPAYSFYLPGFASRSSYVNGGGPSTSSGQPAASSPVTPPIQRIIHRSGVCSAAFVPTSPFNISHKADYASINP